MLLEETEQKVDGRQEDPATTTTASTGHRDISVRSGVGIIIEVVCAVVRILDAGIRKSPVVVVLSRFVSKLRDVKFKVGT